MVLAAVLSAGTPPARDYFRRGLAAEKAGRMAEAFAAYSQAAGLEPGNRQYWMRSQAVRSRAELEAAPAAAEASGIEGVEKATARDLMDSRVPLPPTELAGAAGTHDFDLRGSPQSLFETVAKAYGLECVFDSDYRPPSGSIRFTVTGVSYREALHFLEAATGSFVVPLSAKRFVVARDTDQKRKELEPTAAVRIQLPDTATAQDFTQALQAVQQALALEKVSWSSQERVVVMRDRLSKLIPARALFEDLMRPRAEVGIELELLDVSRNDVVTYGLDFGTSFPIVALSTAFNNSPSVASGIAGVLAVGGGRTMLGLGIVDPSLVAKMSQASGSILTRAQVRSSDGQSAALTLGDRYPVVTSLYTDATSTSSSSTSSAYAPQVSYEDLGLSLKVTPTVHDSSELTLDIDASFREITGTTQDGLPVISNRSIKQKARLRFGSWAIVGGLLDRSQARTISGLSGLSRVPVLGVLGTTHKREDSSRQVLVMLRPVLLSPPAGAEPTYTHRTGSDTRPLSPL
jgi:general secretion pathway protein D